MENGRLKLLGVICIPAILLIIVYCFFTSLTAENNSAGVINREFDALNQMIRLSESMIYDRLIESSYLLAENSTFKANLQLGDKKSLDYSASEFALFMKTDLFVIVGRKGQVKFDHKNRLSGTINLAGVIPVKKALAGFEPDISLKKVDLFQINDIIYQIVAVPVYAGKNRILGAIIIGINYTDFIVKPLAESTPFSLFLFYNDALITSFNSSPGLLEDVTSNNPQNNSKKTKNLDGEVSKLNLAGNTVFKRFFGTAQNASLVAVYAP